MEMLAALECWGYETSFPNVLDAAGEPYVFRIERGRPARDWLIATLQHGAGGYLPGMLDEEQRERMMTAIEFGELTLEEIQDANKDAIEQVSGWKWWEAAKLIATLAHSPQTMLGLLSLAGVDIRHDPIGAVLGALYARLWVDADPKQRAKLATQVATPPASLMDHDNWDDDVADEVVRAMMAGAATGYGD